MFVSHFKIFKWIKFFLCTEQEKKKIAEQSKSVIKLKVPILSKYILNYLK